MYIQRRQLFLVIVVLICKVVWCDDVPSDFWRDTFSSEGFGVKWMYFPDGDEIPRKIPLKMPPAALRRANIDDEAYIEYRYYSRDNIEEYILLDDSANPMNQTNVSLSDKLSKKPIKVITHGWMSSADKSAVINIKHAYLKSEDVNVIAVDWSSVADSILYPAVALRTRSVGAQVGEFLNSLEDKYQVSGKQIHLVGHSLGAHVMGNAGHVTCLTIDRITGLDPARPLFEWPTRADDASKLDPSDADFVDVIHTCAGALGFEGTVGHADFFPNSGVAPQPGCFSIKEMMEACSHSRSHFFFAESITNTRAFPACSNYLDYVQNKCRGQKSYMGEGVNRTATGRYFLDTNANIPYGRGDFSS